jgi:hypothetical protein
MGNNRHEQGMKSDEILPPPPQTKAFSTSEYGNHFRIKLSVLSHNDGSGELSRVDGQSFRQTLDMHDYETIVRGLFGTDCETIDQQEFKDWRMRDLLLLLLKTKSQISPMIALPILK